MSARKVLYDVCWQKLRVSLRTAPALPDSGFSTLVGTLANLDRLSEYLDDQLLLVHPEDIYWQETPAKYQITGQEEHRLRVWRVLNLLNATRMGFHGTQRVGTPADQAIVALRDTVSDLHRLDLVVDVSERFSWNVVHSQLLVLRKNEPYWYTAIRSDLQRRRRFAARKMGGLQHRSELETFLHLMDCV